MKKILCLAAAATLLLPMACNTKVESDGENGTVKATEVAGNVAKTTEVPAATEPQETPHGVAQPASSQQSAPVAQQDQKSQPAVPSKALASAEDTGYYTGDPAGDVNKLVAFIRSNSSNSIKIGEKVNEAITLYGGKYAEKSQQFEEELKKASKADPMFEKMFKKGLTDYLTSLMQQKVKK